jgi:hypothetical protein
MSERRAAQCLILMLALAGLACGHPEQKVVNQYFNAVNAQDNQTLASFAAVSFDKKVEKWSIDGVSPEQRQPAPLPELVKKVQEIEMQIADNKKTYNAYFLEHPKEVDQVRELLKKSGKIPASLKKYAEDWKGFIDKEHELKKRLAEAKAAVEKEKRGVQLSLGQIEDVEALSGGYTMTLRKYEVGGEGGARPMSRWFVSALEKRG